MRGMARSLATAPNCSAMLIAWASLSITQGPAIKNSGAWLPKRIVPIENCLFSVIVPGGSCTERTSLCRFGSNCNGSGVALTLRLPRSHAFRVRLAWNRQRLFLLQLENSNEPGERAAAIEMKCSSLERAELVLQREHVLERAKRQRHQREFLI